MTPQPRKAADLGMYQLTEGCDSGDDLCWEQPRVAASGMTCSGVAAHPAGAAAAKPLQLIAGGSVQSSTGLALPESGLL